MQKFLLLFAFFLFGTGLSLAQTNPDDLGIRANLAAGEVKTIDAGGGKIVLQTKDGAIDVNLSSATSYKRVSPEKISLSTAVDSALTEISVGDKVLVTGAVAADKKSMPAKAIYLIRKDDIAKKNDKEREAWRTRGIAGKVTTVDLLTRQITISVLGGGMPGAGERSVVVKPKEQATFRRYAPDSVSFADARVSSLGEVKVGDRVRALGDRSPDGALFQAEEIVSGAFSMVGGTITAIDAQKNEITIKELGTNKPVTILVKNTSVLKKFPAEMAQMMAMRPAGGGAQPVGGAGGNVTVVRPPQGTQPPAGQTAPSAPGQGGGMVRGSGRGEFDDMLDRFPSLTLADLKVGDAIAVSSTTGATSDRYTAIKLLSGVEPFFQAQAAAMAAGAGRGGAQAPSLNIPGLDGGIGAP